MKRSISFIIAMLTIASTGSASASLPSELRDRIYPVQAVVEAVQHANPAALSALYANDAMIVDDRQPFEWNGADAGTQWLASSRWAKWSPSVARFQATLADAQIYGPDHTYIVMACVFSSADPKNRWQQKGTLTFTLRKGNGGWKITSQVWAQTPLAPN